MIKVELTKNVFNQRGGGLFGLKPIQLVFAAVAVVVGGVTVLWLMQYGLSIDLIGWIVFIEMTIIIGQGKYRQCKCAVQVLSGLAAALFFSWLYNEAVVPRRSL